MTGGHFGGFWRRAIAYSIDKMILQIIGMIFFLLGMIVLDAGRPAIRYGHEAGLFGALPDVRFLLLYYAAAMLMDMAYFTWFHGATGQTPGKMAMRLRVIQETDEPMTFGLAFLRWVGYIISAIPTGLGFLWIAFDGKKRGWHDRVAGTVVVFYEKSLDNRRDIL